MIDTAVALRIMEAFRLLEGSEFGAYANLSGSFEQFCRFLEEHPTYLQLRADAADNGVRLATRGRSIMLLQQDVNRDYEHPLDVPIAAYVLVMAHYADLRNDRLMRTIATTPGLFWARQAALYAAVGLPTK